MEHRAQVAQFLRSRRDRITPDRIGIASGGQRCVPGLRREEVALLAGISVEYYARMERGNLAGVSPEVLGSLARALQLDEAKIAHLADLARTAGPTPTRRPGSADPKAVVNPSFQRFLDAVTGAPMWVRDRHLDFVAANALGRAFYAPLLQDPGSLGNSARFAFLNPAAQDFFLDWEDNANDLVATLRSYAGQSPHDERLSSLIGELVIRSDTFRDRWTRHDVRQHRPGVKRVHHPVVGDLELTYEVMELPSNRDWFVFAFTAEPGSPSQARLEALKELCDLADGKPGEIAETREARAEPLPED